MADLNPEFGIRLKEALKRVGMTQKELSEQIGIRQVSVTKYTKRGGVPEWHILVKIARLLNISCDWLLTGEEPEGSQPSAGNGRDWITLPGFSPAPLSGEERAHLEGYLAGLRERAARTSKNEHEGKA